MNLLFTFSGLVLLMLGSAFFSGSETALSALTRIQLLKLRRDKSRSCQAVVSFLDEPRRLLITVLFGNILVNMAFVSITGSLIYNQFFRGKNPALAYVTAILVETLILLILGEITPKTFAIKYSEKISKAVALPLWFFSQLIYPFRKILRLFTDIFLPVFGVRSVVDRTPITSDEIRATITKTEEFGALDTEEGEILHSIFELHDTKVKEIMIPRTQMVCVDVSQTIQEAFRRAMKVGHSRLPVYRGDIDNICGVFCVKDLPRWRNINLEKLGKDSVEQLTIDEFISHQNLINNLNPGHQNTLIRPPFFVFKTRDIGTLLREMTQKKQQMAIILDEFGGVIGLATAENIIEEVLGEIVDEYDAHPKKKIVQDPDDKSSFIVPGSLNLRGVNRQLKLKLDVGEADTLSGYVIGLMGFIPDVGNIQVDAQHKIQFEVLKMEGNRIDLLKIRMKKKKSSKKGTSFHAALLPAFLLGMVLAGTSGISNMSGGDGHSLLVYAFLLVFSLVFSAFYSGSETAVVSVSEAKIDVLAQRENRRAMFIKKLMQTPDQMLGIVLVGTNLMSVAAGVAGLQLIRYAFPGREGFQELINTLAMTFIILLFCEIVPKTVFRAKADTLALKSVPLLFISSVFLRPVVSGVTRISNLVVNLAKEEDKDEKSRVMREELKLLAKTGEEEGALKKAQLRMIQSLLDLEVRSVEKVMTPLVEVFGVPEDTRVEQFLESVSESGFSRIPVYAEHIDHIVGVINILDVLYADDPAPTIAPYIRKDILHVPKSKRVLSLLRELSRSRNPMALVVDEYGGVVGLVTIEDIVEEIMGDIRDERDRDEDLAVQKISDRILDCEGKTEIHVLNRDYNLSIHEGDYNTIAGYVVDQMQKIPRQGESFVTQDLRILVLDADAKSVHRVRIMKK